VIAVDAGTMRGAGFRREKADSRGASSAGGFLSEGRPFVIRMGCLYAPHGVSSQRFREQKDSTVMSDPSPDFTASLKQMVAIDRKIDKAESAAYGTGGSSDITWSPSVVERSACPISTWKS
jgi:hypothetical protein